MKNISLLALLLFPIFCNGQNLTTKGVDFWFGFGLNAQLITQSQNVSILISSDKNTSGQISIPLQGWNRSFEVSADSVTVFEFPLFRALPTSSNVMEDNGIHLTSNDSVSLVLLNSADKSTDATNVYPVSNLGTEYFIFSYLRNFGALSSQFYIVAPEDNTIVEITPSDETIGGGLPGVPYEVTMQSGGIFQVRSDQGNLTGTLINSSNPVAVFGGHECAILPDGAWCDHLVEQMQPVSQWGTEFIALPLATRLNGNTYIIMASEDDTEVLLENNLLVTLNAGEFSEQIIEGSKLISSNKPINVGLYSNSQTYDSVSNSDPFLTMLTSLNRSIKKAIFSTFVGDLLEQHYVNILVKTAGIDKIELDGNLIPATEFTAIPLTEYSFATTIIEEGIHILESIDSTEFSAYTYGYGNAEGYGYSLGDISSSEITTAGSVLNKEDYHLYPNPTNAQFTLTFNNERNINHTLKIFQINGTLVKEISGINTNQIIIDRDDLVNGLYIIQLGNDKEIKIIDKILLQ